MIQTTYKLCIMFSVILVTFQNEKGGERMGEGGVSLLTEILAFQ